MVFWRFERISKEPNFDRRALGEMFKRTHLTLTGPFMRSFKMATFLEKSPYYRPWFFGVLRGFQKSQILTKGPYYRPCFLGEMFKRTQLTLTDPFMRNFKNGHIFGKSPYYRPWFFGFLRGFQKSPILTERSYYRPCFLGEMFKRTQLTLTDPFMRNFKMLK